MNTQSKTTNVVELTVTPKMAAEYLETRPERNRTLSEARVEQYARAMAEGRWVLNGETLKFDRQGKLIDGQHRCAACVKSGSLFRTMAVLGLEGAVFDTVDTGRARSVADVLTIRGHQNTKVLGAALRYLWAWERGVLDGIASGSLSPQHRELEATLSRHPRIAEVVTKTHRLPSVGLSQAQAAFVWYVAGRADLTLADLFFGSGESKKLPQKYILALLTKAWNATLTGQRVDRLLWLEDREPFPTIAGNGAQPPTLRRRRPKAQA